MPTIIVFTDGSSIKVDEDPQDVRDKLAGDDSGWVAFEPITSADHRHHVSVAHVVRLELNDRTGSASF